MFFENEERTNELYMKNSSYEDPELTNIISKSICKIEADKYFSSGFLIKLIKGGKDSFFLITNEHVITKQMIKSNEKIKLLYDKNKLVELTLNSNDRFIRTYDYMNIDACLVEILPSDNIDKSYFLPTPKLDLIKNYERSKNQKISIFQFPCGGVLCKTIERIIDIDLPKYEIYYKASTDSGSSGSPIFLANTKEVLGIHKQGSKNYNIGNLLCPIIESLGKDLQFVENYNIKGNEIYEGEINKNNLREGFGKNIYKDGSYYKGQWKNDKKYGIGIEYNNKNQIIYKGEFVNNEYDGEGICYKNWEKYKGQWKNDKKNGKGEIYDKNNIKRYDGEFKNNEFSGKGFYFYENGQLEYDGSWENNKRNGKGFKYYEGEIQTVEYDGEFINDRFHGNGIYYDKNGKILFDGKWKNNKKNGKGRKYYENSDNVLEYEGEFIDDDYHGIGRHYYRNGDIEYNGMWKNGKRSGKGEKYHENNKLTYYGNFENDQFNGKGISYYRNGKKEYEGDWRNDKKNGRGKKYYENEDDKVEYEGGFNDNEFDGEGTSYYKNGKIEYEGQWKNGKKEGPGEEFFNNGIRKAKGFFKNGELYEGEGSKYEKGKVMKFKLKAGEIVNESKCW